MSLLPAELVVLACGGRHYADHERVAAALSSLQAHWWVTELVHGAATGADTLAAQWAASQSIKVTDFPANWAMWGKRAGRLRNQDMLFYLLSVQSAKLCVAFPGGSGTCDMVHRCQLARVPVWLPFEGVEPLSQYDRLRISLTG